MKTKLTPWYPPEIKPVRVGVYKIKISANNSFDLYSHWTGQRWLHTAWSPARASEAKGNSLYQNKTWRGLTEKS